MRILLCLAVAHALTAQVSGPLRQWTAVTVTVDGPRAKETDDLPELNATFAHSSGTRLVAPAYFAADGNAANSSATEGSKWRAHLMPDKAGEWTYELAGQRGTFRIQAAKGLGKLEYAGGHYLRWSGSGEYFLKAGTDSPETLLAYAEFDGTETKKSPLKLYKAHTGDWRPGDPVWKDGRGKGLIGAINYLASKGINSISFLTYNAMGDGDNVWPFVSRDDKMHYDVSKLDQWGIVFAHAGAKGMHLHFKLQETENDDERLGDKRTPGKVSAALDGGKLGPERKRYIREMIARFAHLPALNWNLSEESTQTAEEQREMAQFIRDTDPYRNNIVIHTHPNHQDEVYPELLGTRSVLTGASLQNNWNRVHERTLHWLRASEEAGRPWVVANDEQGSADHGVPPDDMETKPSMHDIRKQTLWGNLMAGGAGVEYYFGYKLPENDLLLENFRSRDKQWGWQAIALRFFRENAIPFWEMKSADSLVKNGWCLAKGGEIYLVYLSDGGATAVDLSAAKGSMQVSWFDPRNGGPLKKGAVVKGGGVASLGPPPDSASEDWVTVIRK